MSEHKTYLVIDGENIDATLGMSVLNRRPDPDERPRWDRVLSYTEEHWDGRAHGLFFLNASSGHLPMGFVQALMAMSYHPIPLSGPATEKVVDVGVQRMLDAICENGDGDVILASHDADFEPQIHRLLQDGRRVGVMCFNEFLSTQLADLIEEGLEVIDLEHQVHAFQVPLPRLHIIDLEDFNPEDYL